MRRWLGALILAAGGLTGALQAARGPGPDWRFAIAPIDATNEAPRIEHIFEYQSPAGTAHAPAFRVQGNAASLIWFDGSREAAPDVRLLSARLELGAAPAPVLTPGGLERALRPRQMVRFLGNTIQFGQGDDLLSTFVSLGGWAAASIAYIRMGPDGEAAPVWARKLTLSPFFNRSHLVRAPAVRFENGDLGVPAYFEMGAAFGEFVRISPDGRVRDKRRMSHGLRAIQPMLVPLTAERAVAFLRDFSPDTDRLVAVWTEDGGQSWSAPRRLALPNPDAPVAALRLAGGRILMAFNDAAQSAETMDLAVSEDDGHSWRRIARLDGPGQGALRYPAMTRLPNGDIALAYSFGNKQGIRGWRFNESWVDAQ